MTNQQEVRVFCAVDLPSATKKRILNHIQRLKALVPAARASWSRESNLHLTLKFIGEIPVERVQNFQMAISRAVDGVPQFPLVIAETGVFRRPHDPKVLWVGITDQTGDLIRLQSRLETECEQERFPKEARQFHPHLTLARIRHQQGARELARAHMNFGFAAEEILVAELILVRSELGSGGSKYTTISRHQLHA